MIGGGLKRTFLSLREMIFWKQTRMQLIVLLLSNCNAVVIGRMQEELLFLDSIVIEVVRWSWIHNELSKMNSDKKVTAFSFYNKQIL